MASSDSIAATSRAILTLLEDAWSSAPTAIAGLGKPNFQLFHSNDFDTSQDSRKQATQKYGVSLYLYRVAVNGNIRPISRQHRDGKVYRGPLLLDLYYLLTAWAENVDVQQRLLGWCLSTLHETPILPTAHLNAYSPDEPIFRPNEAIEIIPDMLSLQDFATIWDKLKPKLPTSMSYLVRMVALETKYPLAEAKLVQTRQSDQVRLETAEPEARLALGDDF